MAKKLATPWRRAIGKNLPTKVRRSGKDAAGRGAVAELLAGALQRRAIGKMLPAGAPGDRYLIQQRRPVQKAFLQRSNC